ncbi:unnamed protein product [Closterium sp. Naga37s-1]|nr:unnamed protein product [Closterium sp. Naga37s-1]
MTHGRQPHGCLLPALLTTRSARGGHLVLGGAEARRRHFSRGVVRCGMVRKEDGRARWDDARPAATGVWLPPTRPADHPLKARRTLGARRYACDSWGSRQGGHLGKGGGGNQAALQWKVERRVAVGRVEAERVVPLSLESPPHGWPRSSLLLVFFLQHRPPCTSSSSFDAQPDLHSVLIPFPPSRRAHGESTASRPARGEAEEREGVVDGLDEWMHGGGCSGKWNGDFDAQPDLHSVLIPFPPSRRAHGESTASRSARGRRGERQHEGGRFRLGGGEAALEVSIRGGGTSGGVRAFEEVALQVSIRGGGTSGSAWFERGLGDASCPPRATAGLRSGGGLHGTPATVVVVVRVVPHEGSPPQRGVWV